MYCFSCSSRVVDISITPHSVSQFSEQIAMIELIQIHSNSFTFQLWFIISFNSKIFTHNNIISSLLFIYIECMSFLCCNSRSSKIANSSQSSTTTTGEDDHDDNCQPFGFDPIDVQRIVSGENNLGSIYDSSYCWLDNESRISVRSDKSIYCCGETIIGCIELQVDQHAFKASSIRLCVKGYEKVEWHTLKTKVDLDDIIGVERKKYYIERHRGKHVNTICFISLLLLWGNQNFIFILTFAIICI